MEKKKKKQIVKKKEKKTKKKTRQGPVRGQRNFIAFHRNVNYNYKIAKTLRVIGFTCVRLFFSLSFLSVKMCKCKLMGFNVAFIQRGIYHDGTRFYVPCTDYQPIWCDEGIRTRD